MLALAPDAAAKVYSRYFKLVADILAKDTSDTAWRKIRMMNETIIALGTQTDILATRELSLLFVQYIQCTLEKDAKGASELASGILTQLKKLRKVR